MVATAIAADLDLDARLAVILRDPDAESILESDPFLRSYMESAKWGLHSWIPRPDKPEEFDEQEGFVNNRDRCAFLVGGNASGTTTAACMKLAKFVLEQQPPPRRNTPFWIVSNTYEQVCSAIWDEKLDGMQFIPECEVEWSKVRWNRRSQNWPFSVPLKPWPDHPGKNWVLEFKSFEQGRGAMQARSIGGFFFSEQFPLKIFLEVLRGCRECMFPGGQFAEFTPIDPELCIWVEQVQQQIPDGWRFYRCNTELNRQNLAAGWYEDFLAVIPDEMRATRITGALATFEGVIYPSFQPAIHVFDDATEPPLGVQHYRGIDWGASKEHPFVCLWGYRDGMGDWTIYDEYWSASQTLITEDHAMEILERSAGWGWPWPEHVERPPDNPDQYKSFESPWHLETFADPSRPGEIAEFNQRGIDTSRASNEVYAGIDTIRTMLKVHPARRRPRLRIHARCKHTIEEMRKYRWKRGRRPEQGTIMNPQVAAPTPLKLEDDCPDALRYLIHSVEKRIGIKPGSSTSKPAETRKSVQLATGSARR